MRSEPQLSVVAINTSMSELAQEITILSNKLDTKQTTLTHIYIAGYRE